MMQLQSVRFGQFIPVKLEAGEHAYSDSAETRARTLADEKKGRDVVLGRRDDEQQLGVVTGLHKTAMELRYSVEILFHELMNMSNALTYNRLGFLGMDRSLFSLQDAFSDLIDRMILQSKDVDRPEQAVSEAPANLKEMPEPKFDEALGYENPGSLERLEVNTQNQGKTMVHLFEQLVGISEQLSPDLTSKLKDLGADIQFKVGVDMLEDNTERDTAAMLRTRARQLGFEIELKPLDNSNLDAVTAQFEMFEAEPDEPLQILKGAAAMSGFEVTKATPLTE